MGGPDTRLRLRLRQSRLFLEVLEGVEAVVEMHLCINVQEHVVLVYADQRGDDSFISDRY